MNTLFLAIMAVVLVKLFCQIKSCEEKILDLQITLKKLMSNKDNILAKQEPTETEANTDGSQENIELQEEPPATQVVEENIVVCDKDASAQIEVEEKTVEINLSQEIDKTEETNDNSKDEETSENPVTTSTFESMFMGNLFNKIGAIALLVGIGIFVKLISPYIVFTDEMKIASGFIAGILTILGAFKIQQTPKMKNYAEVLMGTGFGFLLITTYCATSLFGFFNVPFATVLASLIVGAIYYLADKQKTISMLVIGLIGGYANPFFINPDISTNFLFSYLIFLNLLSIVFVYRNPDKNIINILNLILTSLTAMIFSCFSHSYTLTHILVLWGIYIVLDVLTLYKGFQKKFLCKAQTYINFSVLSVLSFVLFFDERIYIGWLLLFVMIVYCGLSYAMMRKGYKENDYLYSAIAALFLSTYFLVGNTLKIYLWSLEAVLLALFASRFEIKKISYCAMGFLVMALSKMFLMSEIYDAQRLPIFNWRLVCFIPTVVSGFVISKIFKKDNLINAAHIVMFLALTSLYTFVAFEVADRLKQVYDDLYLLILSYTVLASVYAINLKKLALLTQHKLFSVGSYLSAIGALILLFVSEFAVADMMPILNLRIIIYIFVTAVAFMYFCWTKNIWYKILYVSLIYWYAYNEMLAFISDYSDMTCVMLVSALSLVYSVNLKYLSIKDNHSTIEKFSYIVSVIAIGAILISDFTNSNVYYFPVFNVKFLAYVLAMGNVYYLTKNQKSESLKYIIPILGFACVHFETVNFIRFMHVQIDWLISVMWILYTGLISYIGIILKKKYLKIVGTSLSLIVILRVFIYDFPQFESIYKIIASLTLGVILMIISYFYNKNK